MGDTIPFGVIGLGSMGTAHCRYATGVEELELQAVADIDAEQARSVGEQYGVEHFADHRELLESGVVEAVSVVVPHFHHREVALDAFRAGVHVLCEKPLAVRAGSVDRMLEEARENDCVFSVMFQRRTEPVFRKARQIVEGGGVGPVRRTLLVVPEFRPQVYYDAGTWRATWAGEGGGPLVNQGPHMMDIFLMLGGVPVEVRGRTRTVMHEIEVEDEAQAALVYENGARGYLHVSTCEPEPGALLQVFGDRGKLQIMDERLSFARYTVPVSEFSRTAGSMWDSPEFEEVPMDLPQVESGQREMMRNFARSILGEEDLHAPAVAGLHQVELSNAIMLSSWTGEPASIPVDREAFDALLEERIERSRFRPGTETQTTRITDPKLG